MLLMLCGCWIVDDGGVMLIAVWSIVVGVGSVGVVEARGAVSQSGVHGTCGGGACGVEGSGCRQRRSSKRGVVGGVGVGVGGRVNEVSLS